MSNDLVSAICIISAVAGSSFAVWWNTPDNVTVSHKQLAKAISVAAFGAFALVDVASLPQLTPDLSLVGLIVSYLLIGAGLGKASNHLQINTSTSAGNTGPAPGNPMVAQ